MPHRETMSLGRPCPSCGGPLLRKTVNPKKPLGMVSCSKCQFKSPIDAYSKSVRADVMAKAKARKAQG
jgi:uncharacterized Zn finger protein (UPF0148 family)